MESWKELAAFVLEREGGYVNNKADKGGPTNKGVTLATYRSVYGQNKTVEDLKRITDAEWEYILRNSTGTSARLTTYRTRVWPLFLWTGPITAELRRP